MTEVNSAVLDIVFQNFDVVLLKNKKKAIYFDGRFYFANGWTYTTQDNLANKVIYNVKKIFRIMPAYYNGDAFRFLHNDYEDTHNMTLIYEQTICACCGQILSGEK